MPYGLRSGTPSEKPAASPRQTMDTDTQTEASHSDFESFVRKGIADIRLMLTNFEEALEFQSNRTAVLEQKVEPLQKKVQNLDDKMLSVEQRLLRAEEADNKLERFSRRNNFRIVGVPQRPNESPMQVATNILQTFFGFDNPNLERAHRDGPQVNNRPRHLLVKMLSFQDKKYIVSQQRKKLEKEEMYIVDDLTKKDREEKKKWQKDVQQAFQAGTRYHFSAGKWRDGRGMPAAFYSSATTPERSASRSPAFEAESRHSSASVPGSHINKDPPQSRPRPRAMLQVDRGEVPPRLSRIVSATVHAEDEIAN